MTNSDKHSRRLPSNAKPKTNSKSNSTKLIETFDVEETPFKITKANDKYFVRIGDYRLTEMLNSKEEAMRIIEEKPWKFLITTMIMLMQSNETIKKHKKQ